MINYISTHFQTRTAAASNPFVSQFPVGASATVSAESHASFYQIVDLDNGAGTTCVLEGTGEDVQMLTPAGANSCTFVGTSSTIPVTLSALFQYSKSGPTGPTSNSKVQTPTVADDGPFLDIIIITTEDDTDDDNNDTFLTIAVLDPSGLPTSIDTTPTPASLIRRDGFSVSNDGIDIAIGAFSGSSTTNFVAHTSAWSKVTGKVYDHQTADDWANYMALHFVFSEGTTPETENATLTMTSMVRYVS